MRLLRLSELEHIVINITGVGFGPYEYTLTTVLPKGGDSTRYFKCQITLFLGLI